MRDRSEPHAEPGVSSEGEPRGEPTVSSEGGPRAEQGVTSQGGPAAGIDVGPGAIGGRGPDEAIDVARTATGSLAVVAAVLWREWAVFRRVWFSTAFGSVAEPVILFVSFGFGFGALVAEVAGLRYLDFIATGAVAIGVLFSSIFPALINGYFRRKEQQLYDGLLAAPMAIGELVTGEALWNALRATTVAIVTVGVAIAFGVRPSATVVLTPLITVVAGFGFAAAGAAFGAVLRSTHGFDMIIVGVIVPMYVVAGTFFPIDGLPGVLAAIAYVNPLYHVVELLRVVTFATPATAMILVHVAVIVVFDVLAWFAAVRLLRRALID